MTSRRHRLARLVPTLALFVAGCAAATSAPPAPPATAKVRGPEIVVHAEGQTHYFENRHPHCLAFALTDEWDFGPQRGTLRIANGTRSLGVTLIETAAMAKPPSGDDVTRAAAAIVAEIEDVWGQRVQTTVESLPASRKGTILLRFEDVIVTRESAARVTASTPSAIGQQVRLPIRVIAPFAPGLVLVVTVDDARDAREVLGTLAVTEDPQCWGPSIPRRFPGLTP